MCHKQRSWPPQSKRWYDAPTPEHLKAVVARVNTMMIELRQIRRVGQISASQKRLLVA
jgi:hypothetical protein